MKDITILGAGVAGLSLIEKIRQSEKASKITLIDKESYSFNKKEIISSLCLDNCIEIQPWAQEKNVEFIKGCVERINPKRKKIYFKGRDPLDFDNLIIATGLTSKKISVKGEHREGFFYLSKINPFELRDLLKIYKETTVFISTILGIKLASNLHSKGSEVNVVSPSFDFLSQDKEKALSFLKANDISLYYDASIEEAIGEGVVKAIKITPLKVFSSQLVFIDSGFVSNCDFFEEELIQKDTFFTDYEGVYLLGDVTRCDIENESFFSSNYQEAKEQGGILADYLLEGKTPSFEKKVIALEDKKKIIEDLLKVTNNQ